MTARLTTHDTAIAIAAHLPTALKRMEDSLAGYPTSTPLGDHPRDELGALTPINECPHPTCTRNAPCDIHDHTPHDNAQADRSELRRILNRAHDIIQRWTTIRIDNTTVDLTTYTADIWCTNCARWGFNNVRKPEHTLCPFCDRIKTDHKKLPNKQLLDIHATGRNVTLTDIERAYDKRRGATPAKYQPDPRAARQRRTERLRQ